MTAVAQWPAEIPTEPRADGFSFTPQPNVIPTEMDAGPPKRRRRSTARLETFTERLKLDDDQRSAFWAWYEDILEDGVLTFSRPHPRTGLPREMMLSEPPSESRESGRWSIDLTVVILP
jgi:hypothetical protein